MLPLPANAWFVVTEAMPTKATRYHAQEEQASLPDALPAGTLVRTEQQRHKHVGHRDHYGHSLLLVPVRGVVPLDHPDGRAEALRMDKDRTAWRRWCDREATVAHTRRFDEPIPVLATDERPPVRPATAADVQPLFDAVQAARKRALDQHHYAGLEHHNQDVASVFHGLDPKKRRHLVAHPDSSPRCRWEASGLNAWRFAAQHAAKHTPGQWAFTTPTTPRSEATAVVRQDPENDAVFLLKKHAALMRWTDRIGASHVTDWLDEALATLLSDRHQYGRIRQAEHGLQRLPALDKPVWSLAEQEARDRLVQRTVDDLEPWWTMHVQTCVSNGDERVLAAQTLHRTDEAANSPWNAETFRRLRQEALPLLVQELLWQRKQELDLQAAQTQALHAEMDPPSVVRRPRV